MGNFGVRVPYYVKISPKLTHPFNCADFQSIFARSTSAVTPSEKSSINANRKSITSFQMTLRWTVYVAPKSPKGGGGVENAKCPKFKQ